MKKRKTITFDQDLILVAHALPPGERGQFYELLIEHFLNGQEFPATLTPTLHLAICTMSPKIRNLQSKFLNGKCTKATLCPSETSEMKRNEANESEIVDDMLLNKSISNNKISSLINYSINHQNNNYYNNILYKNISSFITYIKNHQNSSNEQISDLLKNEQQIAEALINLQIKNPIAFENFKNSFENVIKKTEIKISGASHTSEELASAFFKLLNDPAGVQSISDLSDNLESNPEVRNKSAYFSSMIWNHTHNNSPIPKKYPGFSQRSYTQEDFDNLFNNL